MANELNIKLDTYTETGLALLGKLYNKQGDTQFGSNVSMTETANGHYTGNFDFSTLADGQYLVVFETTTEYYGDGVLFIESGSEVNIASISSAQTTKEY